MPEWIVLVSLSKPPDREWYLRKAGRGLSLSPRLEEAKRHSTLAGAQQTLEVVNGFPDTQGRIEQLPSTQ